MSQSIEKSLRGLVGLDVFSVIVAQREGKDSSEVDAAKIFNNPAAAPNDDCLKVRRQDLRRINRSTILDALIAGPEKLGARKQ